MNCRRVVCLLCAQSGLCCFYTVHSLLKFADRSKQLVDCWRGNGIATVVVVAVVGCRGAASRSVSDLVIGWARMGFDSANHQQHKQHRHCNTCCVRVHAKPPYSSSCYSGFSRQDCLQNRTECLYERPASLQCTRHRVISPITDIVHKILTSRKICATARYGELC